MKWIFLFSTLVAVPINLKELTHLPFASMSTSYLLQLGYIILFATFIAYFLLPIGQKRLRPTVVSLYTYVQPLIGMVMSICLGMDTLGWQKIVAAAAVGAQPVPLGALGRQKQHGDVGERAQRVAGRITVHAGHHHV